MDGILLGTNLSQCLGCPGGKESSYVEGKQAARILPYGEIMEAGGKRLLPRTLPYTRVSQTRSRVRPRVAECTAARQTSSTIGRRYGIARPWKSSSNKDCCPTYRRGNGAMWCYQRSYERASRLPSTRAGPALQIGPELGPGGDSGRCISVAEGKSANQRRRVPGRPAGRPPPVHASRNCIRVPPCQIWS